MRLPREAISLWISFEKVTRHLECEQQCCATVEAGSKHNWSYWSLVGKLHIYWYNFPNMLLAWRMVFGARQTWSPVFPRGLTALAAPDI